MVPLINGRFKLNFDGSMMKNKIVLGWVIRESKDIIKMATCRNVGKSSIIVVEYMILRYDILVAKKRDIQTSKLKVTQK